MNRVLIGVCVALALLSAMLWRGRDNARDELAERSRAYVEAQRQAAIKAEGWRVATEAKYRTEAERADNEYQVALTDALRRARLYAAANRVRSEAVGSASIGTIARATGDSAGSADGPGQEAVVVASEDVEICTINTARLEAAREWARGLNPQP